MSEHYVPAYRNRSPSPDTSDVTVYVCFAPEDEVHARGFEQKQDALQSLKRLAAAPTRRAQGARSKDPSRAAYSLAWTLARTPRAAPSSAPSSSAPPPPFASTRIAPLPRRPPPQRLGRPRDDTPLRLGVIVRQAMFAQGRTEGVAVPNIHPEVLVQRLAEERRELREEREREHAQKLACGRERGRATVSMNERHEEILRYGESKSSTRACSKREKKFTKFTSAVLRLAAQGRMVRASSSDYQR